jgi:hypothetical protein
MGWELLKEAPHADVWHEGMPFNNETQDNLLQQMACDVCYITGYQKTYKISVLVLFSCSLV